MGVYGLWKLIEPSGKPVPLDTLENKVLAVDVSIWLHQAIKGFQDSKGGTVPNAHLLGIYHRVCKLLYYKIKPVFVFDGGVPILKKQTIARRQQLKAKNLYQANSIQQKLISTLLKHSAVAKVLSERTRAELEQQSTSGLSQHKPDKNITNIYALPESQLDSTLSEEEDQVQSSEDTDSTSPSKSWDLHTIDVKSAKFMALSAEMRHEILTELKDTRKQNSWGRLHELPTQSDEFSGFQMNRLLNRYSVQASLEEVEKEMGGHSLSLKELEALLKDTGVITKNDFGKRIASDENQKILFIKDVQEALRRAKEIDEQNENKSKELENKFTDTSTTKIDDEVEQDLQTAIKFSLRDQPSSSKQINTEEIVYFSSSDDDDADDEASTQESTSLSLLSSAKNYMTEYSGLTPAEINNIISIGNQKSDSNRRKCKIVLPKIDEQESISKILNSIKEVDDIDIDEELKIQQFIEESIKDSSKVKINSVPKDHIVMSKNVESFESTASNFEEASIEKSLQTAIVSKHKETIRKSLENTKNVEEISDGDSSSSDLIEVEYNASNLIDKPGLQVVVDKNEVLNDEDDLFKDIFGTKSQINNVTPTARVVNSDVSKDTVNKRALEIVIDKNSAVEIDDDLFNDIFTTKTDKEKNIQSTDIEKSDKVVNYVTENRFETVDNEIKEMLNSVQNRSDTVLSENQLKELKDKMREEKNTLYSERVTKERMAENISDQMYKDAQELLQLFGIPYIVAPMEAEAQCAFLEIIGLTDGSITDDSDIWLFGGKTVYKNFFNHTKLVLEFRSDNIEHHFHLSREQLILLAMLVGSDYTTGIPGVGPVTALEILAAFPIPKNDQLSQPRHVLTGLVSFRKWFINGKVAAPQKAALRTKLKNCEIFESFPNLHILNAYLQPEIDSSKEKFSWSKPDNVALIDFARSKFGWTIVKAEEILNPVLKRLADNKVQKSVKDYFKSKHKLIDRTESESKMSKRVKKAVDKLDGNDSDLLSDEELQILKETKAISKRKSKAIEKDIHAQIDRAGGTKTCKRNEPKKPRPSTKIRFERSNEPPKPQVKPNLHRVDCVYQKELAKNNLLQNRLKAIETFRKSKAGPGYVKKRKMVKKVLKDEAELSEDSDSN